ncbi:hypothetical protein CUT44_08555 [Streptomyces carminius]|uniref:Uncharacterized protein n=1 Tax=Streptomyces carminius TaxID=2665496 RepID=A0A2M8M1V5_9ACTN|nr:hypothetical protein CUT44_08555 [Streptomyces carminius]
MLPRLARYVRSADSAACCFFSREDDATGPSVELWLDSTPEVRRAAADLLRSEPESPWRPVVEQDVPRPVHHPHESGRDVRDELAAVSTEFALSVPPGGEPGPKKAFDLGTSHLRGIVELLPEAARPGFLFQCWQSWSAGLSPWEREKLAAETDMRRAAVPHAPSKARLRYLDRTRRAIRHQRPGNGLPEPYLIFHQAGATHGRLGVPPAQGAAAALALRSELAERTASPVPVAASGGHA